MVLIGAGTGVAPLAGFIRQNDRHSPMHLYFGGRDPARDFFFGPEIQRWLGVSGERASSAAGIVVLGPSRSTQPAIREIEAIDLAGRELLAFSSPPKCR